jgi:hypothetical protein
MGHVTVHHGHGFGTFRARSASVDSAAAHPGRHRKVTVAERPRRWLATWAIVAAVLVVGGVVASLVWTTTSNRSAMESVASATAVDPDAAEWMRSNLPDGTRLLTDAQAAPPGFPNSSVGQPDQDWHAFDYLLTKPGDPPLDTTVAAVWQASVPVAVFPTVQVRRIVATAPDETLRTREADRADRLVAGTALLSNPSITASPQAQTTLAAGGLDLRAAATLTALSGSLDVDVVDIEQVKAEAAASMPARAMTIHAADPARVNTVLSGLTAAFRADQVIVTPDGTYRLHWPLSFAPVPSVN